MPFDDSRINDIQAEAKRIAQNQSSERNFGASRNRRRDGFSFFNLASGISGGVREAQGAIGRGDPISAAALALGGALSAPTEEEMEAAREAQMAQARLQTLEAQPIQSVSPGLVQELEALGFDAKDLPVGAIQKLAPLIEAGTTKRRQDIELFQQFVQQQQKQQQQGLQVEEGLRKEFTSLSKDFRTIRDSYARVNASGKNPSAAGDLALIFNYMKILDPGSVVRESEFANAQNAAGVSEQVRAQYNRVLSGERLSDATRQDFLSRANDLFQSQVRVHQQLEGQYRRLATSAGVSSENVVIDQSLPEDPAGGPAGISIDAIRAERQRRSGARPK